MGRVVRIIAAAWIGLLLASCESNEPLGPTPLDEGIVIYLHSGYRGISQQVGADVDDLGKIEGPCGVSEGGLGTWNDCVSSIRVLISYCAWGPTPTRSRSATARLARAPPSHRFAEVSPEPSA